jgi:hypothetical protein
MREGVMMLEGEPETEEMRIEAYIMMKCEAVLPRGISWGITEHQGSRPPH